MSRLSVLAGAICAAVAFGSVAYAQQPAAPPGQPAYGPVVTIDQAKKVVAAALAEAKKSPYQYAFAVVEPSGSLVYFEKMDGAPYASNEIALRRARNAATFKRPTADVAEADVAAGGLPLLVDGKIIGGIGVSGSPAGPTDLSPAQAGANALK